MRKLRTSILKDSGKPNVRRPRPAKKALSDYEVDYNGPIQDVQIIGEDPALLKGVRKNSRIPKVMTFFWSGNVIS